MSVTLEARRTNEELKALAEAGAAELGEATAAQVVDWVARNFAVDSVAVACSMADSVLPHIVSQSIPEVEVLFLETGYHFLETKITRDEVARQLPVRVVDVKPKQTVAEQDAQYGEKLYERDPGLCCQLRMLPTHALMRAYTVRPCVRVRMPCWGVMCGIRAPTPAPHMAANVSACCCRQKVH